MSAVSSGEGVGSSQPASQSAPAMRERGGVGSGEDKQVLFISEAIELMGAQESQQTATNNKERTNERPTGDDFSGWFLGLSLSVSRSRWSLSLVNKRGDEWGHADTPTRNELSLYYNHRLNYLPRLNRTVGNEMRLSEAR